MKNFKKALIVVSMISTLSAVAAFADGQTGQKSSTDCQVASDATSKQAAPVKVEDGQPNPATSGATAK